MPGDVVTPVGAVGTARGVTGADGADSTPYPAAFVAATVNTYVVPFVNPGTVHGDADAPPGHTKVPDPYDTRKPDTALPPLFAGVGPVKVATAEESSAVTAVIVGAAGVVRGLADTEDDVAETPAELVAVITKS